MHLATLTQTVELPSGVTASTHGLSVTLKGPKGEITRSIGAKSLHMVVEGSHLKISATNVTRNTKRTLMTAAAHIRNMAKGAAHGHLYKLKICSGHFPMSVTLKGETLEVKNFIGEAVPRVLSLKKGCVVKINGQEITVESANKELAGNQAAAIELLTRRPGFDTRVFQDGIYIVEKDGKHM